ncbi:MAG: 4Fe-4S binding protein [Candidatus Aenigmarchaeota archaeon]|nr:4Fe-4S binding protein [Candidatus Aenigmarchaeota archaeon]
MAAEKSSLSKGGVVREAGSTAKNKTGTWRTFRPIVTDKCIGCGTCVLYCPEGAITLKDVKGKKRAVIDYDICKGCLICIQVCPQKAITSEKEK